MIFIDKLVLKQNLDWKLAPNANTCLMLEFPLTSDYDEMDNGVSK